MAEIDCKAVIEAMLFAAERPLYIEQIRKALEHLGPEEARRLLEELKGEYEHSRRGMRIQEVAGGFQMVTPAEMAVFLKKFYKERRLERLSKPALETLAIIAYKQPLTKQEVEVLRQVNVDGLLQGLLDKGLVRVVGRKKTPGRPKVYGTTREFLEYFGLKSLEELPKIENFQLGQGRVLAEPSAPAADSREERDAISQAAPEN